MPVVRDRLRALVPDSPARISTLEERIRDSAADRRFAMLALSAFGADRAGAGRHRHLRRGVVHGGDADARDRDPHGARCGAGCRARSEVLRDAASMALGGIAAGTIAGLFATRYLESSLYGISRRDPIAYIAGGAILLAAALLGAYVPARRSSRVDPLLAIRGD